MNLDNLKLYKPSWMKLLTGMKAQQINLGVQFLAEFDAAIRRIFAYPKSYALLENEIRRCLIKRFPYGILYGIDADTIVIIAVAHLHRKPNYWVERYKG